MEWIVFAIVFGAACGGGNTAQAPRPIANTAPAAAAAPAPAATLRGVTSAEAYCTALARKPKVRPPYGGDELVQPGCIFDHAVWSESATAQASDIGPFTAMRVLPITTARGAAGCALFVEIDDRWYASDDAVTDCYVPGEDYEQISGSFNSRETRALIQVSAGHDPCGCDDDLWVGHERVTVCGVTAERVPVCTQPIETQHTGATNVMRTWAITNRDLELSPWWYGTHLDAPTTTLERALDDDGGGPGLTYRLGF